MSSFEWITTATAVVAAVYFFYKTGKKASEKKSKPVYFPEEEIESLSISDVKYYFKSLQLKKGRDIPFICDLRKVCDLRKGSDWFSVSDDFPKKGYLLATHNEETGAIENAKILLPKRIDSSITDSMGNDGLIVLS